MRSEKAILLRNDASAESRRCRAGMFGWRSEWARGRVEPADNSTGRRASKARVGGGCDCGRDAGLYSFCYFHGSASERSDQEPGGNQANATIDGKEAEEPKK